MPKAQSSVSNVATTPFAYSTSFPLTENPISESGKWVSGGINPPRTDVRTDGVHAFGTMVSFDSVNFADSIAILTQSFAPNQSVQGILYNQSAVSGQEAELVVRGNLSVSNNTGYELDLVLSSGTVSFVSWNGPDNSFTVLKSGITANASFADGAVWYWEINGKILTARCNGLLVDTYDTTSDAVQIATGNPGIGFWNQTGVTGNSTKMGWKSVLARNL